MQHIYDLGFGDFELRYLRDKQKREVDFLIGYCELANLQYDKAKAALERFERFHPDAPDKFRLPARQMLAELEIREPGSLGEVSDLMNALADAKTLRFNLMTDLKRRTAPGAAPREGA